MAYSGMGEYMRAKRTKLMHQNELIAASASQSTIFQGLVFYFNGYIAIPDIKETVLGHGALVQDYYNSAITHIIASQMTDSKIRSLRTPVVNPTWLKESIEAQKLLPWMKYKLYNAENPNQTTLQFLGKSKENHESEEDEISEEISRDFLPELDFSKESVRNAVCTAPGFLTKYFASSRLHHLSTWKTELIQFVADKMKSRKYEPQAGDGLYFHVDMDCFFASVALRDRPELKDRPVVIAHCTSDDRTISSTAEIASCNYPARDRGIKNGSSVRRAKSMADDLVVLPYDFKAITECTTELYSVMIEHSDFVQVFILLKYRQYLVMKRS